MKQYLTNFNTRSEYEQFVNSADCPYVNVSYIESEDKVEYHKENVSTQPFTLTLSTKGSTGEYRRLYVRFDECSALKWSLDNGDTWKVLNINTGYFEDFLEAHIKEGDSIQIIAKSNRVGGIQIFVDEGWDADSDDRVTLSGNIMSLVSGDSFAYAVPWNTGEESSCINSAFSLMPTTIESVENLWLPTRFCKYCFREMFNGCTNLTDVPIMNLNIQYVPAYCFYKMFCVCSSLTDASNISLYFQPVVYLEDCAFANMFEGCHSLTDAPTAAGVNGVINRFYTNTDWAGFGNMFKDCYALTSALELGYVEARRYGIANGRPYTDLESESNPPVYPFSSMYSMEDDANNVLTDVGTKFIDTGQNFTWVFAKNTAFNCLYLLTDSFTNANPADMSYTFYNTASVGTIYIAPCLSNPYDSRYWNIKDAVKNKCGISSDWTVDFVDEMPIKFKASFQDFEHNIDSEIADAQSSNGWHMFEFDPSRWKYSSIQRNIWIENFQDIIPTVVIGGVEYATEWTATSDTHTFERNDQTYVIPIYKAEIEINNVNHTIYMGQSYADNGRTWFAPFFLVNSNTGTSVDLDLDFTWTNPNT